MLGNIHISNDPLPPLAPSREELQSADGIKAPLDDIARRIRRGTRRGGCRQRTNQ